MLNSSASNHCNIINEFIFMVAVLVSCLYGFPFSLFVFILQLFLEG
nr:MAG TPA: hypothetical protein [Caudoviricetes sp.]